MLPFQKFDKIPRLSRDITITEKIDGTNGQIYIINGNDLQNGIGYDPEDIKFIEFVGKYCLYVNKSGLIKEDQLFIFAGSRKRWLDCSSNGDNYGFAKWVKVNAGELINLGEGRHYGEWWGKGIQRNYGVDEKRFSLFNTGRWVDAKSETPIEVESKFNYAPKCCGVVPILYNRIFDTNKIDEVLKDLEINGSKAAPGFMNAEGVVIYHVASGRLFKKTIKNDEQPKIETLIKGNNDS